MKKPKPKSCCDNCGRVFPQEKLNDIQDAEHRLDPVGEVATGECPRCGALCYLIKGNQQ